jgi:hypothetical protein
MHSLAFKRFVRLWRRDYRRSAAWDGFFFAKLIVRSILLHRMYRWASLKSAQSAFKD